MKIVKTISELRSILDLQAIKGSVGFVPTMGALHEGHLSLVDQSVKENPYTVSSIFVNPTQFNNKSDLERYPRDQEKDCSMLASRKCDLVFAPSVEEMYPEADNRNFNFGALETVMEGNFRPGHFNGVAQIVSKLFNAVRPGKAYFGLKDFQQLAIIQELVRQQNYTIEIVPCAIIREADGLAMSSRNILLENSKRTAAPFIYETLKNAAFEAKTKTPDQLRSAVEEAFKGHNELELEYFEIVDNKTLQPIRKFVAKVPTTACIAVHAGKVRLIDNIQIIL